MFLLMFYDQIWPSPAVNDKIQPIDMPHCVKYSSIGYYNTSADIVPGIAKVWLISLSN